MRSLAIVLLTAVFPLGVLAAVPVPGSDIWLLEIQRDAGRSSTVATPRNLTFRPGYDNQPVFSTDNALLFTSMGDDGQTDIWRLDLVNRDVTRLLKTPESEYSPTIAPDGGLSVVRVAMNGVQQLWQLAPGATQYQLLFPMLESIGYHAWIDHVHVALFMIMEDSAELHVANRDNGQVMVMAKNIGRSLQPVPGATGSVAFVEDGSDGKRWIKQLDFHDRKITPLAPVPGPTEDFAYFPDGRLVTAAGKRLLVYQDDDWQLLGEFGALPGDISRIAVSPGGTRVALVVAED